MVLWRATPTGVDIALRTRRGAVALPAVQQPKSGLPAALALARRLHPEPGPPGPLLAQPGPGDGLFWPFEARRTTSTATSRLPEDMHWTPADEAPRMVTMPEDEQVLAAFLADRLPRRPVVMVRHASAGKRSRWEGRDEDRPLDERGRSQAAALVALLSAFDVQRIHSSDALRCRDTVAPLAATAGLSVEIEPLLGEAAALRHGDAARRTLLQLVRTPGRAVLCVQRKSLGVTLPALLAALGLPGPVAVPRKGGLLVLHIADGGGTNTIESLDPVPAWR